MTSIIFLGEFRELTDGLRHRQFVTRLTSLSPSQRDVVATYLEGGVLVTAVPGLEEDVIDGTLTQKTSSYRTDGHYIWHAVLAHYVRKYGVGLDGQFVNMVLGGGAPLTSLDDELDATVSRWLHDDYERKVSRNKRP